MFDRGDSWLECLIEETAGLNVYIFNVHNILWQMLVPGTSRENLYAMNKSLIEATVIVWDRFLYIIKCLKYTVTWIGTGTHI
jgi:hypothetical protein